MFFASVSPFPASIVFWDILENKKLIALIVLGLISLILLLVSIIRLCSRAIRRSRMIRAGYRVPKDLAGAVISVVLCVITVLVILVSLACLYTYWTFNIAAPVPVPTEPTAAPTEPPTTAATEPTTEPTEPPTTEPTVPPTEPDPMLSFNPHMTADSDPANWGVTWEIIKDGQIVDSYTRETSIHFGDPEDYFPFEGVSTFRGNNYRNDSSYGVAEISEESISQKWSIYNGTLNGWPGCGWTGQPLVIKWDAETKAIMNMYDSKKAKEDLVEVIYATLDGYIYFLDLDDGSYTRDRVYVGMNMKGSGSLDPRGYPLMYVGSGDYIGGKAPRMYVISLIDGSILYERGYNESYAKRSWSGFDSAPLVAADADTLIWPGENGLLYTIKLNTTYDKAAGTISIDPDEPVMARYTTNRSGGSYWLGMEDSVCVVGNYLYVAENGGMFFCVDLNTMELIWAQDTKDDNNATPVFEWGEDGNGYLYTAPSLHWTTNSGWGQVSIYKLDAQTGEIIWERPYECGTITDLSGGVQSSPVVGRTGSTMEGMVVFSISYTPTMSQGILTALDTETGETIWELEMSSYGWSSPVAMYTEDGKGYILMPSFIGTLYLIDGATGEILDTFNLGSHMEASPVIYENKVVIGTRGTKIYGLEIE